jgi:hypothetical protein
MNAAGRRYRRDSVGGSENTSDADLGDGSDLFAPPWSHIVVQFKDDADQSRELVPQLNVVGLDDPRVSQELPTGPDSCVLALGSAMRAAGDLRGFGVEQVYGTHLPLGTQFLSQWLEERAAAVKYFGGSEHLIEVLNAWTGRAHLLDVAPVEHPGLPRPPRLKGRPFQELLDLPTPKTLIQGCLAELSVIVLGGASRTWKSFLMLDWHLSLFWGVSWRGRRVIAGSSVYFCGEGQAYAGRRVKAWLQKNADRIREVNTNGRVFEIVGEVPALTKPVGIADLRDYLREFVRKHGPVSLVTFDTLSVGLSGDDDENNNPTLAAIVAELGRIRNEFGCTAVLVHHFRKDAGDGKPTMAWLRGGVALSANADQVFLVQVADGEQVLWLDKNKDGQDDLEVARSALEVVPLAVDEEGQLITSAVLVPTTTDLQAMQEARLVELVEHYRRTFHGEEFTQSLAEQMKPSEWGREEVRDLLAKARESGRIRWRQEGKTIWHKVPEAGP